MKIFQYFFWLMLSTFFGFFVISNFYMWVLAEYGVEYNILGVPVENLNGFFGFQSMFHALQDFPTNIVKEFTTSFWHTFDALNGGLPKFFVALNNADNITFGDIFTLLTSLTIQPLYFLGAIIQDIVALIDIVTQLFWWIWKILGGWYNVEYGHTYPYPI